MPPQPSPLRILLAEDNAVSRQMATMLLVRAGYHADSATTGLQVLEALRRQTYDVILMDVQMPEMDGLEAARRIRQEWPIAQWPWIVAVTGSGDDREACMAAGMDDYISKPLRAKVLTAALEHARPYNTTPTAAVSPAEVSGSATFSTPGLELDSISGPDVEEPELAHELSLLNALERKVVERLLDSFGPESVIEFIDLFLEDAPLLVTDMGEGLKGDNAEVVQRAAHTLKSSAGALGAMSLSDLCQEVEAAGKIGDLVLAEPFVVRIEQTYTVVGQALEMLKLELAT